jgi:ATP-dependent helicase HrpA
VEGDWDTHHEFLGTNQRLLEEATALEERVRRRGLVVDDEALYEFYGRRLGPDIVSGRHFDSWWKQARRETPDLLTFDPAQLLDAETGGDIDESAYPLVWSTESGDDLPLSYVFAPGAADDGVSVDVPLAAIDQLRGAGLAWQVPGLRSEIVVTLLRGLPKPIRRRLVPVPDTAAAILSQLPDSPSDLLEAISAQLLRLTGVSVETEDWDLEALPSHLRTTFRIVDAHGEELGSGKNIAELKAAARPHVRKLLSAATGLERSGLTGWDFDTLPRQISGGDGRVTGYPALADGGSSADVICNSEAEQRARMPGGVRRLLRLTVPAPTKSILRRLGVAAKLALAGAPHRDAAALLDDCADCAAAAITGDVAVWDRAGFDALADRVAAELPQALAHVVDAVLPVLTEARGLQSELESPVPAALRSTVEDIAEQLSRLYYPGFIAATGAARLPDLRRYLQAARQRLDRLREAAARDADSQLVVRRLEEEYATALVDGQRSPTALEALVDVRWMLQELRVSLFAQNLGTKYSVSPRRVERALDAVYDLIRAEI